MKIKTTVVISFAILFFGASLRAEQPFWQQTFGAGLPTTWSTGDDSGQGVVWENCTNPSECPPASIANFNCLDDEFRSPGFADGYAFVNMIQHGVLPMSAQTYLRTEGIDCSGKSEVFLRFHTLISYGNGTPETKALLRVKKGNGTYEDFTIFPNLNYLKYEGLLSWNAQPVLLDISEIAGNEPDLTIEWRWESNNDVAWLLDDVALFDEDPMLHNAVWGHLPGQGDFNGGPNGWTVLNTQLDTCKWNWASNGQIHLPDGNSQADWIACWSGADNGAMLMNTRVCTANDVSGVMSRSDLRSPSIDLSGVPAGTKLLLKFNQAVSVANPAMLGLPTTSVAVSLNNGFTYIDTLEANPLVPYLYSHCHEAVLELPAELAGQAQVRLLFIYASDIYFWMVDDVRIVRAYDFDIAVNPAEFEVSRDFAVPSSQVQEISLYTKLQNIGSQPLTGVLAFAGVKDINNNWVFMDSVAVGDMAPGGSAEEVYFPEKFTPTTHPDEYTCFYWAAANEVDERPENDKVTWKYRVTDDVFAKNELCGLNKNYFTPSDNLVYEIGNCYYVPKGSLLRAESLSFAYNDKNDGSFYPNTQLSIRFYAWKSATTWGDANQDSFANPNEYTLLAANTYDIMDGNEWQEITVPLSFNPGELIQLEDETYYFATVGYLTPAIVGGQPFPFYVASSEEVNYTTMFYHSYTTGIPAFVSMLREGDDLSFRANAWALRRIPFVNLNVVQVSGLGERHQVGSLRANLQPNPATGSFVSLHTDLVEMQGRVQVEIFDLCGRLMSTEQFENRFVSQLPIDIGSLSNGSYLLRIVTDDAAGAAKLLVTR